MRVRWTRPALADLEAVGDHLALDNPRAAAELVRRIHGACAALGTFPAQGRPGRVPETRELVISGTPYIAAYAVLNGEVAVLAVVHSARRWPESF